MKWMVLRMFNEFNDLHDSRQSNSIPYFSFYDYKGDLIKGFLEVEITDSGQFGVLTCDLDGETIIYPKDTYTYTTECLYVLGIGFLIPGDIVKLKLTDYKEYELNFGWHTNISGQTIYSWYLIPKKIEDLFINDRNGIHNNPDLADMNINNNGILTFYKEYLQTIEVVEFKKDRISFDKL